MFFTSEFLDDRKASAFSGKGEQVGTQNSGFPRADGHHEIA
jgi:hypothetical protein